MKLRLTNRGKTIELEIEIENNRVYFKGTTNYYDLIDGDKNGIKTLRSKMDADATVEIIQ